jgi:para-aminobenzoate synthetase component 1
LRSIATRDAPVVLPWHGAGPLEAARRLRAASDATHLAWLDSALTEPRRGRWSIVAAHPRWLLRAKGRRIRVQSASGCREFEANPIDAIAAAIAAEGTHDPPIAGLPFTGGAIGYLGYELGRQIEVLPATTVDDTGIPDAVIGWYDAALVWDGIEQRGWLAGTAAAVEELRARLEARANIAAPTPPTAPVLRSNFERGDYLAAIERARRYIAAGDIYQVNLSQRFSGRVQACGFDLYERLRAVSPASFAAYVDAGDGLEVLSSSPERLLEVEAGRLETRPIKGTRPRGRTPAEDERLARELLASTKDRAEHVMIVDLQRNDLGRVAVTGSVCVPEFAALESFAQVHHLTSTVVGQRRPDAGLGALLRAIFPGGSVTGAPKIRAMQIIDELEPTARGVYTGAIGYFSAQGRIDLNIAIRTITLHDGTAHLHAGGAIVHDSVAEQEYTETLDKARGMARALGARLPDEAGT